MSGLMLLDTPSLYFRAFFGVPESVKAPDGTPVNAVRGLVDMIATLVRQRSPERLVCAFDADWRPEFRVRAMPSYKAHRVAEDGGDQVPDALAAQLPVIDAVLDAVGLARAGVPGYEADDVIGTLAVRGAAKGPVDIVTGDRDLFQLVDDRAPVEVLYTARGIRNLQVMDEAAVAAKYGIPGRGYGEYATLRGDPSDGLPGVPGVGDKTAAALVTRFGSVPGIIEALDSGSDEGFPAGARRRLEAARAYLAAAPSVVRVVTDIDAPELTGLDDRLPATPRDPEALLELADTWNLASPVNRLLNALRPS
ncbi:5'-3' exonuclease [Actinomadura logoneensis]|uniref:5'-3' exonuclease n=1 Tax=Actinomadura logoneensis TaxID=2293572 RepID=A0A372JFC9_9ACTN|nr:5'-3' exonuclease [Actinomadura logoneensis]RFU38554.1 5'-3' exonuclease [Actinomadura logoneensis]